MTFSEIILEKLNFYLGSVQEEDVSIEDIEEMILLAKTNDSNIASRLESEESKRWMTGMAQIIVLSALEYGEKKWNEAIQTYKKEVLFDKNLDPVFIP